MSYRYHNPDLQGEFDGDSNGPIAAFFAAIPKNAAPTLPPTKAQNRYLRAYMLILAQYAALRLAPLALLAVDKQGQYQKLCRRIWSAPAPFNERDVSTVFDLLDEARTEMMGYRHSKAAQAEDAIDSAQAFLDSAFLAYSGDDADFEISASDLELFKSAVKSTLAAGVSAPDVRRYLQKAADALSSVEPAPTRASNPPYKPKHIKNLMLLSRVAKDKGLIPRTQNPKIGVPAAEARLHAALYEFENASDSERNIRAKAVASAKVKYEKEIGYRSQKRADYAAANEEFPRTPNHHRTGLIGDDYPIDPYKHGQFTDDPYNRYWTEGAAQYSGRGALQYVGRKTNGDEFLPQHLELKKRFWEKLGDFVRAFDCKASKARDKFVDGFEGNEFIAKSFRSLQNKMDRVKHEYEILSAIPANDKKKILAAKNKLLSSIASLASFAGYVVEPPRIGEDSALSSRPDFSAVPHKLSELDDLYKDYARSAKKAHTIF